MMGFWQLAQAATMRLAPGEHSKPMQVIISQREKLQRPLLKRPEKSVSTRTIKSL